MIRIAIVEDEEGSVRILKKHLKEYSSKNGHQFKTFWFKDGLTFISEYEPKFDIIFMDIKMPHMDGMKASKKLRKIDKNVALIFITNMMQYAIKGYEVNALDFMLKPVKYFDFQMKMDKAMDYVSKHKDDSLTIDMGEVKKKISLSELLYIEVINHTLIFHTEEEKFQSYGQLKKMEEKLRDKFFARCNNCYLINLRHVEEVHSNHIIVGKDEIQVSRRKKKEFIEHLTNYIGSGI